MKKALTFVVSMSMFLLGEEVSATRKVADASLVSNEYDGATTPPQQVMENAVTVSNELENSIILSQEVFGQITLFKEIEVGEIASTNLMSALVSSKNGKDGYQLKVKFNDGETDHVIDFFLPVGVDLINILLDNNGSYKVVNGYKPEAGNIA